MTAAPDVDVPKVRDIEVQQELARFRLPGGLAIPNDPTLNYLSPARAVRARDP